MTTNTNNSRPQRQTLASQIDRLETILAGLTDTLGQTVAEAVQDAVGKAVELAVKEVLTNSEVLRALQAQAAPTAEPAKSAQDSSLAKTVGQAWKRAGAKVGEKAAAVGTWLSRTWAWAGGCLQTGWVWLRGACGRAVAGVAAVCSMLPALLMILWSYRKPLLIALTVSLVIGLGSYWAGPFVASFVSGLLAFVGALVVNLVRRLRAVMEAVRVPGNWVSRFEPAPNPMFCKSRGWPGHWLRAGAALFRGQRRTAPTSTASPPCCRKVSTGLVSSR
jgi:hypothetical protein